MKILKCPNCKTNVAPMASGECPSCRSMPDWLSPLANVQNVKQSAARRIDNPLVGQLWRFELWIIIALGATGLGSNLGTLALEHMTGQSVDEVRRSIHGSGERGEPMWRLLKQNALWAALACTALHRCLPS